MTFSFFTRIFGSTSNNNKFMKKLFLLLLALFAIINSKSQVQSDCTVPTELMTYYERDIKQLAVCRMFQIHSADTARVKIPREYIDTIAGGMAGLINLIEEIPQIDSPLQNLV